MRRKYTKADNNTYNFLKFTDYELKNVLAIGVDKENVPYCVKFTVNNDLAVLELHRAIKPFSKHESIVASIEKIIPDSLTT